jgi:hypothetical protein
MSEIIDIKTGQPTVPPTTPAERGIEAMILGFCADWKVARAKQEIEWAEDMRATEWGYKPSDHKLSMNPLDQMLECEGRLAMSEPPDARTACALLHIAVEILACQHVDRESYFANGPVLEIVRNVLRCLERLPGDTRLELLKKKRSRPRKHQNKS